MSLVSVIIPTFNRADFIVASLESVLAQTYRPLEIIIVDNGSTDDTLARLEPYADKIILCHEPKSGMGGSYARNTGLDHATGDYIAFLDSDDLWRPTKIEKQVELLQKNRDCGWCYTDMVAIDPHSGKKLYQYSHTRQMHEGDVLAHAFIQTFSSIITLLIRQEVLTEVGRFWPVPKGTDADFIIRLAGTAKTIYLPEPLVVQQVHQASVTGTINGQEAFEAGKNIKERAIERFPKRLTPLRNQAVSSVATAVGLKLLQSHDPQQARMILKKAIRLTPTNFRL
ncbi:MAG: glycosyltransferase family 2 protein, partial [Anaerolineae bacterium]